MKKISHIWSIICTSSITDQNTNNISLFNLVEKYAVKISKEDAKKIKDKNKLIIPFKQELISRFLKNIKNENVIFDMRIDIINPEGKTLEGKEVKTINFDKKFQNIRIKNIINTMPFVGSGLYYFSIKIKEVGEAKFVEMDRVPVEIIVEFEK